MFGLTEYGKVEFLVSQYPLWIKGLYLAVTVLSELAMHFDVP